MDPLDLLTRLTVSLAIGLLVGLERGWKTRDEEDHSRAAGFRTFALSGFLGGVTGALALELGGGFAGAAFIVFGAVFAAFHWLEATAERNFSVTSVVAGLLTFLLGAMAVLGDVQLAVAGGVAMTLLLALREPLHRWVASLTWEEIRAVLILLAMTFLLLPVLPNRPVDPWATLNPYEIWLLAILVAAISFGGYIAVRLFGDRLGIILTAVAGGLASSTAVTLAFARMARQRPASTALLGAGILTAGAVMMVRVGVVAVALNPALLAPLLPPLAAAAAVLVLGALFLVRGEADNTQPKLAIANPLAIGTAIRLAALIGVVMLAAELFRRWLGDAGVLIVAAASGVIDVDAITISMARLDSSDLAPAIAATAILVAVAVNTAVKAIMATSLGGRPIGRPVGAISSLALAAGLAAIGLRYFG